MRPSRGSGPGFTYGSGYGRASALLVLVFACFAATPVVHAQTRSDYFDEPGEIVLPENYEEGREYPLLVLLPYTGGTAHEQARAFGIEPGEHEDVVLLLPEGRFDTSDYLPDFQSFVDWFEQRLYTDISEAIDTHSIDDGRVYVAGYSLGGDLSWALSVRNPEEFAGAIVAGSRSSHPVPDDTVDILADNEFRAAFLIGDSDTPNRYNGLNHARRLLENGDVEVLYREYSGGHELPPQEIAIEALEFISDHDTGRISAAGTEWPSSSGSGSEGADDGSGGLFREAEEPRGRVRIEADLPVAISRAYQTGVGFAGDGRYALVAETLSDRWWFYGDVSLGSDHTSSGTYNRRLSSGLGIAYGGSIQLGGLAGWDYVRWVNDSGEMDNDSSSGAGHVYRRQYIGVAALLTGGRQYTPRAGLLFKYQLPSYIRPVSPAHILNAQLEAFAWPVHWLRVNGRITSGTMQRTPVEGRKSQHAGSDTVRSWEVGAGLSISEDALLSVSYRGQYLTAHVDDNDVPREGYNEQWRLGLRYALF